MRQEKKSVGLLFPAEEFRHGVPGDLAQELGRFRRERLFTLAEVVDVGGRAVEERRIENRTVEVAPRRGRMALVGHVHLKIRLRFDGFHEGETHGDRHHLRVVGDPDRVVGELRDVFGLILLGPGHDEKRRAAGVANRVSVSNRILLEIWKTFL